jgi:hypothetical protein
MKIKLTKHVHSNLITTQFLKKGTVTNDAELGDVLRLLGDPPHSRLLTIETSSIPPSQR